MSPVALRCSAEDIDALANLLRDRRVCVLTGAGISTDSGIPDYRGPTHRHRHRNPVQFRPFVDSAEVRRRYWARAFVGWPKLASTRPNPAHGALARLEQAGRLTGIITQNVDRLHHRAGSRQVLELHGALHEVQCMACRTIVTRESVQRRLTELNPGFVNLAAEEAPDGDAELDSAQIDGFVVADCLRCGGPYKPHVVFFGENVPKARVQRAWSWWEAAEVLLVIGSSLTVFSGYRFVKRAPQRGLPVAIVNLGPTRGDDLAELRIDRGVGEVLPALDDALTG